MLPRLIKSRKADPGEGSSEEPSFIQSLQSIFSFSYFILSKTLNTTIPLSF